MRIETKCCCGAEIRVEGGDWDNLQRNAEESGRVVAMIDAWHAMHDQCRQKHFDSLRGMNAEGLK